MTFKSIALAAFVMAAAIQNSNAFMTQPKNGHWITKQTTGNDDSKTRLYIIGPMLKKMREEREAKKMPMADEEERKSEAAGLRVGKDAWKWPPIWPYDEYMFARTAEIPETPKPSMAAMMSSVSGQPVAPTAATEEPEKKIEKLDVKKYWSEEKGEVETNLDDGASQALESHYAFYLRDGMSVLELGAAEKSYLPEGVKLSRHVGVGLSQKLMEKNPSLSENMVVDLNTIVEEKGVDSDELLNFGSDSFDAILMANTLEYLTNPREVFRTAWYLLKPGGIMMVPFANKEAFTNKFERAQTKAWNTMTDDQHMWIGGSFFQFSAGDGWEDLKGFDITPQSAKRSDGPLAIVQNQGKGMSMFVVQATKGLQEAEIDEEDPEKSFKSKMWMLPTVEQRDKTLLAPRLGRTYQLATSTDVKNALRDNVDKIPTIYEALIKMDTFAFGFGLQSQLASYLVSDPGFNGNDEQMKALKMGLGLLKPDAEIWTPIGTLTAAMQPEDKVVLLAYIVPRFGSGDPAQDDALKTFVSGLEPTFAYIRSKCVGMAEDDVQLLGTDLLARELLKPGITTRQEFASWLACLTEEEMKDMLASRKETRAYAVSEMKKFQAERQAEKDRIEKARQDYADQLQKAKEERTLRFNPESGKLEEVNKK